MERDSVQEYSYLKIFDMLATFNTNSALTVGFRK